jgi:hypothetical protein
MNNNNVGFPETAGREMDDETTETMLGLLDNDGDSEVIGLGCPDELGEYDVSDVGATEADGLSLGADEGCRGAQEV